MRHAAVLQHAASSVAVFLRRLGVSETSVSTARSQVIPRLPRASVTGTGERGQPRNEGDCLFGRAVWDGCVVRYVGVTPYRRVSGGQSSAEAWFSLWARTVRFKDERRLERGWERIVPLSEAVQCPGR